MRRLSRDLSIGGKLGAAFGVILLLLLVVVGDGFLVRNDLDRRARHVAETVDPKARAVAQLQFRFSDMYGLQTAYTASDPELKRRLFEGARAKVAELLDQLSGMASTPDQRAAVASVRTGYQDFVRIDDQVWAAVRAGRPAEGARISNIVEAPHYAAALDAAVRYDELVSAEREAALRALAASRRSANVRAAVIAGVAVLLAGIAALLLTRAVRRPLRDAVQVLQRVAAGDLTQRLEIDRADEIGQLAAPWTPPWRACRRRCPGSPATPTTSRARRTSCRRWPTA